MNVMPDYLKASEDAARIGGEILLSWIGRFKAREKAPSDLVTEADLASQEAIQEHLLGLFPDHGFLAEEDAAIVGENGAYRWIVDPLDGTVNYVHGVPQFAVSVALEIAGRVAVGTVWDPIAKECFTAEAGQGAFLNGERLQTSQVERLADAMVVASFPPKIQKGSAEIENFVNVLVSCQTLRRTGSAALNLSYVAAGRFDGYWATATKSWDVAAGFLLVREAGGVVTNLDGGPVDLDRPQFVAASNSMLLNELRPLVAGEKAL